jgi:hypothetical protein
MLSHREEVHAPGVGGAAVVGLTSYEEIALKRRLRKTSPSEPWVEAQIGTMQDTDKSGRPIRYRYHDVRAFPPGGEQTRMIRCPACGIFVPPNAFEHGVCLDHARHEGWGLSASAVAIDDLLRRRRRRKSIRLEPEDATSLKAEIAMFNNKSNKLIRSLCKL